MFTVYRFVILSCLLCEVLLLEYVCTRTDSHCYYLKECKQFCPRNGDLNVNWEVYPGEHNKDDKMAAGSGLNGLYRPRSALARALYEKQRNDRQLQQFDKNEWYRVDKSRLTPELKQKFVQLDPDDETKEFLSKSIDKSSWVWTQIWYLLAKSVLIYFWSITDINGWLGRGSMFVLSEAHARALLSKAGVALSAEDAGAGDGRRTIAGNGRWTVAGDGRPAIAGAVVDVGAGDGEVSRRFAHLYTDRYATEISGSMRKALSSKGFKILDTDDWWKSQQFSCVCMLNLLDRCSKARTMLLQAKASLGPDGVLMLALVLPYKPYVEVAPDHKPEERLPIAGAKFEDQVASFVDFMSKELGFELAAWTRAPYLCEGDFSQAYYWLDDSVYLFRPSHNES